MGVLTVFLNKCTNLADTDIIGKTDPYVEFSLEQDNWVGDKDYGKQTSSRKSGEQNPVYEETFTFTIPTLDNMVLTCKVLDEDVGSGDDKVGKCKIKLEELGLSETPMELERVIDRNIISANGMIFLSLSYTE